MDRRKDIDAMHLILKAIESVEKNNENSLDQAERLGNLYTCLKIQCMQIVLEQKLIDVIKTNN